MNRWLGLALFMAAAAFVCCGGEQPAAPAPGGTQTAPTQAPSVTIDPATTGSIEGTIRYAGPEPAAFTVDFGADPRCEKERANAVYTPALLVGPEKTLANAVVWVKDGAPKGSYPVSAERAILTQRGCSYTPRVQAVLLGRSLEIRNEDATMHNVHVTAEANRDWNRSQIEGAIPIVETFTKEEVPVTFKCNVHPWMKAQVAILSNPFFAVTRDDGRFEIAGLPAGQYTLAVWHETLGTVERQVALAAKDAATVDFTLPQEPR